MLVKITDNTNSIKLTTQQKANIFLRMMADEIVKISTPKTPKKSGRLRMDVLKSVVGLNAKVKWGKNYAEKMELIQFGNYTTPGTGPHFAENAVNEAKNNSFSVARKAGLIK